MALKIGLEIHGYLTTKEKLFCDCKKAHKEKEVSPNTLICPICTGQPGCKPMLPNSEAVRKLIQIGLMLNCKINLGFSWQRKHYNWPDLPKGYQDTISGSYSIPVGEKGNFEKININNNHRQSSKMFSYLIYSLVILMPAYSYLFLCIYRAVF